MSVHSATNACRLCGEASNDFCWLLDHGYGIASATELVGDRYHLSGGSGSPSPAAPVPGGAGSASLPLRGRGATAAASSFGWMVLTSSLRWRRR